MELPLALKALLLGVVEGLTEFIPVSSTGHLILAGDLLGVTGERAKLFEIVIQCGAILAVIVEYRARLLAAIAGIPRDPAARRFWALLALAFLPAAVLGAGLGSVVKEHLFRPVPVAAALIGGGLVILWAESRPRRIRVESTDRLGAREALLVGLAQTLALVPGVSRSGASILGGLFAGLSRPAATEFSFFLAIPTLLGAAAWELGTSLHLAGGIPPAVWATGLTAAFLSAFVCVRWLLRYVASRDLRPFAWYRIAFGLLVLASGAWGWIDWGAP